MNRLYASVPLSILVVVNNDNNNKKMVYLNNQTHVCLIFIKSDGFHALISYHNKKKFLTIIIGYHRQIMEN